jgi:hypothetical protein
MKNEFTLAAVSLAAALLPFTMQAQLRITEVEASENGGSKPDWWELTNLGTSPVDITGYTMDDNSASFLTSVPLLGVTSINPGESVPFFESAGTPPLTVQGFKDWWGLGSSAQVGYYLGTGAGVSLSNNGDAVNIYTSTGALVDGVSFGNATKGVTFGWNPGTLTFGGLSQTGVNGAFVAPKDGDIGSPGAVPEPSALATVALGVGLIAVRTFRRQ